MRIQTRTAAIFAIATQVATNTASFQPSSSRAACPARNPNSAGPTLYSSILMPKCAEPRRRISLTRKRRSRRADRPGLFRHDITFAPGGAARGGRGWLDEPPLARFGAGPDGIGRLVPARPAQNARGLVDP